MIPRTRITPRPCHGDMSATQEKAHHVSVCRPRLGLSKEDQPFARSRLHPSKPTPKERVLGASDLDVVTITRSARSTQSVVDTLVLSWPSFGYTPVSYSLTA